MGCFRPTAEPYYGMAVFAFAFNVIVLPQLVQHTVCTNKFNASICNNLASNHGKENEVQEEAARWMSYFPVTALLPGFFMIFITGAISDVIGKRKTMIAPPFIYLVQSILFIVLIETVKPRSPGIFLVPYCLTGLFGDNAGVAALSEAYISSITTSEQRTFRLSILESCLFLGALIAAASSGVVLKYFGFIGGFSLSATVNFINFMYVIFLLPEESSLAPVTHQEEEEEDGDNQNDGQIEISENVDAVSIQSPRVTSASHEFNRKDLNPFKMFKEMKNIICNKKRRKEMSIVLVLFFIALFVNMGEVYMGMLYIKHSPFDMKPIDIGYLNIVQALVRAAGVVIIPYICMHFFNFSDLGLVIMGFIVQMAYFTALGLAVSRLMLYLIQIIAIPVAMHLPAFRSMITKLVEPNEYGAAVATAESIDVASSLFTSYISNQIYSQTVHIFPGFTMCLLAGVAFIGFLSSVIWYAMKRKSATESEENRKLLLKSSDRK